MAIFLTIATKGTTLWQIMPNSTSYDQHNATQNDNENMFQNSKQEEEEEQSFQKIVPLELCFLLLHYIAVLLSFFLVQDSDPGYITIEEMEWVSQHDGYSAIGQTISLENEQDHEAMAGIQNNHSLVEGQEVHHPQQQEQAWQNGEGEHILTVSTSLETCTALGDTPTRNLTNSRGSHRIFKSRNRQPSDHGEDIEMTQLVVREAQPVDSLNVMKDNGRQDDTNTHDIPNSNVSSCSSSTTWDKPRRNMCQKCQIAPPLRAHHCKICNRCVATFDHHCGFINTCIGERNHCRFYWFLFFQAMGFWKCCRIIHSTPLGIGCFYMFNPQEHVCRVHWWDAWVATLGKVYLYPLTFLATLMLVVHTWWVLTNGTTFEMEKREHLEYLAGTEMCDLPFSQGLCWNLRMFCCVRDDFTRSLYDNGNGNGNDDKRSFRPILWKPVGKIVRDSEDWIRHPCQNKYWTCC